MVRSSAVACVIVASTHLVFAQAGVSSMPSDAEIRQILVQRVDADHQAVGIVVGVLDESGPRLVSYGALDQGDTRPLNGDTVFEIGSISKVFTALLLTDAVRRGEVHLSDPISQFLPAGVHAPQRGDRQITLQDLATHTSGLPRLPTNMKPADPANPYADYSVDQLYGFLSSYELPREIGAQFEYSNLGFGLLGHLLERRSGLKYETLVRTRIAEPLGMTSTLVTLTPELQARFARGHNARLEPVANWDLPTLAGAGALRSTANDLLTFLGAVIGTRPSPLSAAMADLLTVRRPTGTPGLDTLLGWQAFTRDGHDLLWKDGGTAGYGTFIGYDPQRRAGVVVLANAFTTAGALTGVDDIGLHLLDARIPLNRPPQEHTEITVAPNVLAGLIGQYQLTPALMLTISRSATGLVAQATGQAPIPLFAESNRDFFAKVGDIQITFDVDDQGHATALTLHQGGGNLLARRVDATSPPTNRPATHEQVAVDPAIFDRYVGRYQLTANVILTVAREAEHLFVQLTGQPRFEVFPEGERDFFLKVVDAQLTFEVDPAGRAVAVVLHQNGADQRATRMN